MADWIVANWALIGSLAVAIASLLSAVLPDDSGVMRVVNLIALNVGKAKNDPGSQQG